MNKFVFVISNLATVTAHLPQFPDHAKVYRPHHWREQSEGIYMTHTPFVMYLSGIAGDDLDISLSIPGHHEFPPGLRVSMKGPGVKNMACGAGWNGWEMERRLNERRLGDTVRSLIDEVVYRARVTDSFWDRYSTLVFPRVDSNLTYEPFGVGYYRPLRACNTTFAQTGLYMVSVTSDADFAYSIGLGMEESWWNFFNPLLPLSLARVFHWMGRSWAVIVLPIVMLDIAFAVYVFSLLPEQKKGVYWRDGYFWVELGAWLTLSGVFAWWLQILWVLAKNDWEWDGMIWISVILHTIIPALCCAYFAAWYKPRWVIANLVLALYLLIGAWQSYFLPQVAIIVGIILHWYV